MNIVLILMEGLVLHLFYGVRFSFSVDLELMRFILCWDIGFCLNISLRPASAVLRFHSCCVDFLQPSTGISCATDFGRQFLIRELRP
jgi:hypothetical protein